MAKINFSNESTSAVFAANDYNEFSRLMYDTGRGVEKVSKDDANNKIREVFRSVLGVDENCSRKELHKAIRRHKVDVFEVIEETVENLLVSGWGENPFFNQFVEIKSMADGDTNEFYVPDEVILTVSEISGNHHNLIRQKLGAGSTFTVKTSWYGIKIYTEFELFMAGRVDWAAFVQKVYEAFDKKVNDMVYEAVMAVGSKITPSAQFVKTIDFAASTAKDEIITLAEDVQAANGTDVVIMGTKSALSKLTGLSEVNWISDSMKEERHTTGRIAIFEGITLVEIPQVFKANTTTRAIDEKKLFVMPQADNKFIKIYNEGESQIKEVSDSSTNADMTIEYEYMQKLGVATIVGRKFGVITIK